MIWEESTEGCCLEIIPTRYWKAVSVWVPWKPKRVEIEMWNVSNKKLQCTAGMAMNSKHKWRKNFCDFIKNFFHSLVAIAWWWWAISMWEFRFFLAASFNEKSPWRKILFHSSMHISCGSFFGTILFALVRLWWIYSEKLWWWLLNWSP